MIGSVEDNVNELENRIRKLEDQIQDWNEEFNKIGIMLKNF